MERDNGRRASQEFAQRSYQRMQQDVARRQSADTSGMPNLDAAGSLVRRSA